MTVILSASGVAIAAFCVWLPVRAINRHERWATWTAAALIGVPVLYLLGFGPACWWFSEKERPPASRFGDAIIYTYGRHGGSDRQAPYVYWPLGWLAYHGPDPVASVLRHYATLRVRSIDLP